MKIFSTSFLLLLTLFCNAQSQQELDSLKKVYANSALPDSIRLKAIDDVAWYYTSTNPDSAIILADEELKLAKRSGNSAFEAKALNTMGVSYMNVGNYPKATEYYFKTLKIHEKNGNKQGMGSVNTNLGNIFREQMNFPKAFEYYNKSLKIFQETGFQPGIGACYSNIGINYFNQKFYDRALEHFLMSLVVSRRIGDLYSEGKDNLNIANVHTARGDYAKAAEYLAVSLEIFKSIGFTAGVEYCYGDMGILYNKTGDYAKAKQFSDSAVIYSKMLGHLEGERHAYETLSDVYSKTGRYKEAFENHVKFKVLTDSIFNQENSKQLGDLKTQFEVEKKEAELKAKSAADEAVHAEEKKRQTIVIILVSIVLIVVAIFSLLLYKRFRLTTKQKQIIEEKSKETEMQKHLIEEKQKEIIDSITYAKRLQEAILPPQEFIDKNLKNNFVFYKPKDLVAGDFYWAEQVGDLFFIAAADSTGHGVPGAMVSVVCSNALNRAVKEFNITDTGKILDKTRELVVQTFEKSTSEVKDGMDISLMSINKKTKRITWSGANNPLWYYSVSESNEVLRTEVKADKQPIGKTDNPKPFTTHQLDYKENTTFYLFTDGFADQFGGPKGKKFMYKPFSELLSSMHSDGGEKQKLRLNETIESWKGTLEQVDDICVIGVRV